MVSSDDVPVPGIEKLLALILIPLKMRLDPSTPHRLAIFISVLPRLLLQGAVPCPLFVTPCPFEKAEMTPCPFD